MNRKSFPVIMLLLLSGFVPLQAALGGECELDRPVVFAGLDWGSNKLHVALAGRIIRDGYGCEVSSKPGTTIELQKEMLAGNIDVMMEVWGSSLGGAWSEAIEMGEVVDAGVNFPDSRQGWYVPRYLVEGPDAPAPGLKSVTDLPRYKQLFADPDKPGKGRFYNCVKGWLCEDINNRKLKAYGLDDDFNSITARSSASLAAAIVRASRLKKPVLAYYWEPTWMVGAYDLVMLEEPAYNKAVWKDLNENSSPRQAVAYPTVQIRKAIGGRFKRKAPKLARFLSRYHTSSRGISKALAFAQEVEGATPEDTVDFFLRERESVWSKWVPEDVVRKIKAKL